MIHCSKRVLLRHPLLDPSLDAYFIGYIHTFERVTAKGPDVSSVLLHRE